MYVSTQVREPKSSARGHTFELGGASQNEWERQPKQSVEPKYRGMKEKDESGEHRTF